MVDLRKNVMGSFAKQTFNSAKASVGLDGQNNENEQQKADGINGPICWYHFNYPPLIRVFHYSTQHLRQPFLGVAKRMHVAALLIIVVQSLNILNNIIQVATGCPYFTGLNILYSFLNFFILIFIAFFSFANGFQGLCQGPSHSKKIKIYYISQIACCVIWFIFSIVGGGPLDGWTKFAQLKVCNLGFSIFLGFIQNVTYLVATGLGLYCIIKSWKVSTTKAVLSNLTMVQIYGENPFQNEQIPNQTEDEGRNENRGRKRNDDEI